MCWAAKAGEGHGQVEPHRDVAVAVVREAVELLVRFLAPFAEQDFGVFQGRRVDRDEAVGAIDPPRLLHQPLARDHHLGRIVAKAFEGAGLDTPELSSYYSAENIADR